MRISVSLILFCFLIVFVSNFWTSSSYSQILLSDSCPKTEDVKECLLVKSCTVEFKCFEGDITKTVSGQCIIPIVPVTPEYDYCYCRPNVDLKATCNPSSSPIPPLQPLNITAPKPPLYQN